MKIVRDFDLDCVFLMSEILDKMDLGVDADSIIKNTKTSKLENKDDVQKLGKEMFIGLAVELGTKIVRKLYKAKNQVKELIVALTDLNMEQVGKLNIKEIKEFFTLLVNHEGFSDFLQQAEESIE